MDSSKGKDAKYVDRLRSCEEDEWLSAVDELSPSIHPVDKTAVAIWFRFFPLQLRRYIDASEDPGETAGSMVIQGNYLLDDQIDTSHRFLFGHRFWREIKSVLRERIDSGVTGAFDPVREIRDVANAASELVGENESLLTAISAVGLMTLAHTGATVFFEKEGDTEKPAGLLAGSPERILERRARQPGQGLFGFLKTVDKKFRVNWDENEKGAAFDIILGEEIASAAARDQSRDWLSRDGRCIEGVIPVECRSAACGTCWVGVLHGAENLSDVSPLERRRMKVFGYRQDDDPKPSLRLACQATAEGPVSIVIPPWNGVFGKKIYDNVEQVELEPVTTSAAKLRDVISEVLDN